LGEEGEGEEGEEGEVRREKRKRKRERKRERRERKRKRKRKRRERRRGTKSCYSEIASYSFPISSFHHTKYYTLDKRYTLPLPHHYSPSASIRYNAS
jgi:hypothetical protein